MTDSPWERRAPSVAAALLALPSLLAYYPPMTDLPLHEGVVGVLQHLGDPAYVPEGLYTLNLGHPNQLFHGLSWLLAFVAGSRWAVKLVVALAQVLIVTGAARLAAHVGRTRLAALFVAPLALGFQYYFGLVGNLLGFAALLWALPSIDDALERPNARRALGVLGLLLVLFAAHESVFAMGLVVTACFAALRPTATVREGLLRIAPVALAALLAVLHQVWAAGLETAGVPVHPTLFTPLGRRLSGLPNMLFGAHEPLMATLLLALAAGGVATAAYAGRAREGARTEPVGSVRERLVRHRYLVAGLVLLAGYFVFPYSYRSFTMLYERFFGPAWALCVVGLAPRGPLPLVPRVLAASLPAGVLLLAWPQFLDAHATYKDVDALLAQIPEGSAVTMCALDVTTRPDRVYSTRVAPSRSLAARGGRAGLSLVISPISPVQLAEAYRWNDYDQRLLAEGPLGLRPSHDLERFGWVLVQAPDRTAQELFVLSFGEDAAPVAAAGEWMLFRSRHELRPLLSPDEPPPPSATTMRERLRALVGQRPPG